MNEVRVLILLVKGSFFGDNVEVKYLRESQFIECLQPLESYLYRMAVAILGKDDAQDALQEAILSAFVAREQLRDPERFKPWIKKIVAHQCSRELRKRGTVLPMGRGEEYVFDRDKGSRPDDHLIWQVVNQLPEIYSQVVVLRYLADLSQKEIAESLGIPEGTVKSRLYKGIGKLREMLDIKEGGTVNEMSRR